MKTSKPQELLPIVKDALDARHKAEHCKTSSAREHNIDLLYRRISVMTAKASTQYFQECERLGIPAWKESWYFHI